MFSKLLRLFKSRSVVNKDNVYNEDVNEVYRNEAGYLRLLRHIMEHGSVEENRTGTRTKSLFGGQLSFDLSDDTLPLLTTKHVSFYNVAHELLWFMSGSTNQKDLERYKVYIWRDNSTPEYLKRVGLSERYAAFEDLGPIYSHQWRHFGADYVNCKTDYTGQGVDQLQRVLDAIRDDPISRRIMLVSWNPSQLNEMVLPPCHCLAQFRVLKRDELHCHVYQRSADFALGVPYNIASYGTLLHILAKLSGKRATSLTFSYGDMHVYEPHWDMAYAQTSREIYPFPKLDIEIPNCYDTYDYMDVELNEIEYRFLRVSDYKHHPKIRYEMVA